MKMPLLIRMDILDYRTIEFIVGATPKELERVGRLCIQGPDTLRYIALQTKKINSFHIHIDYTHRETERKLEPKQEIMLGRHNIIGWGYDKAIVQYIHPGQRRYGNFII